MFRFSRKRGLGALALGAALLAGCQSSGGGARGRQSAAAATDTQQAVVCDKCKVTWVKVPGTTGKPYVVAYRTRRSHECPDCRSAVSNFFATGKLQHTCETCGEALEVCKAHRG